MNHSKNQASGGALLKFLEVVIIIPGYIVLSPVIIVALVATVYKEIFVSKKLGVSFTMGQVLQIRWILHIFGTRPDEKSYKLIKIIPNESYFGLSVFLLPFYLSYKILGRLPALIRIPEKGKAGFFTFVNERTRFFDESPANLAPEIKQVVLPGAGLDVRAIDAAAMGRKTFELDQPGSQKFKIEMLKKAKIFDERVHYVPVNFNEESWGDALLKSDYKKSQKTWFLWEGVSNYLDEEAVRRTLKEAARTGAKGSVIAMDLYSGKFVRKMGKNFSALFKPTGEFFHFGLDMEGGSSAGLERTVKIFLKECNLTLKKIEIMGKPDDPFGVLVEAVV